MTYHYKKSSVYLQAGFGVAFFLFSLIFGDWLFTAIGGVVAILMFRDCIKLQQTRIEVKKDRIEVYVKDQLKQSLKWNQLEYVTKTRKNAKWVVVGHMKSQIALKPSLERFDELVSEVLTHIKDNKTVYVHEKIVVKKK